MAIHTEVRSGVYVDSVTLLGVSRDAKAVDGVDEAVVAMATELNLDIIDGLGFDLDGLDGATPNDMVIAVRADDDDAVDRALAEAERALAASAQSGQGEGGSFTQPPPRTVGGAATRGDADLALVSVPGEHAFTEAMDALRAGLHVMVFSDNVPVAQEIALKAEGGRRGLLVMGPDCGTAVVGGVGLGFANVVRPGPVGVVAASGTGAQELCALLDAAGVGVTHVLGVGGRDLSAEVGGASTLQALEALDEDPDTELVVVLSKPPDPDVADRVRAAAEAAATPTVIGFVGAGERDLTAVADEVVERVGATGRAGAERPTWRPDGAPTAVPGGVVRGLFSGGTLCDEAMVIVAGATGEPVASNIPLEPSWTLDEHDDAPGHLMIDFGEDDMTQGRPHPMIDHGLRLRRLEAEAGRDGDRVVLLDVVLGHGADGDPAGALGPAIEAAIATAREADRTLAVVVSVCGTADDPQGLEDQAERLRDAGAVVHLSNAEAAREAAHLVQQGADA